MKYDFNKTVDRNGSYSLKWDLRKGLIPLWVADMDFRVPEAIEDALEKRSRHGVFGYSIIPRDYYDAEILWWKKRFKTEIKREWILPTTGVIPALSSAVQGCTKPGDKVIILSPVYQYFYSSVTNNGAEILYCELINIKGIYTIDFDKLAEQAKSDDTKMIILCNPHNPVGRVWRKDELEEVAKICSDNELVIVSDEIHRDLTYDYPYTPMSKIPAAKELLITCTAPSKTFNIAGLKVANVIVENESLRAKVNRALNDKEVIEPGIFGIEGLIAAYNHGDEWLDELLVYLKSNRDFSYDYFKKYLPKAIISPLEGTYLLWIDLSAYRIDSKILQKQMIKRGVFINGGHNYGNTNKFIRINLATSKANLEAAYPIIVSTVLDY